MKQYSKLIAALVSGGAAWFVAAMTDGSISTDDWKQLATVVVGAVGVYFAPKNEPPA